MSYGIILKNITLMGYRDMLKSKDLLPSRRTLLVGIDAAFGKLEKAGFADAEELYKGLGSPKKLESVSQSTGISAEYLTLLRRELGGLVPKVVSLSDFPGLETALVSRLITAGVKNSKGIYEVTNGFTEPANLCKIAGVSQEQAQEVCALCDFVRVNGVAALFARILYTSGYRTLEGIAGEDAERFLSTVNPVLAEYSVKPLGPKDAQYCIDYATALIKGSSDICLN